jgi:hypothetical protein
LVAADWFWRSSIAAMASVVETSPVSGATAFGTIAGRYGTTGAEPAGGGIGLGGG